MASMMILYKKWQLASAYKFYNNKRAGLVMVCARVRLQEATNTAAAARVVRTCKHFKCLIIVRGFSAVINWPTFVQMLSICTFHLILLPSQQLLLVVVLLFGEDSSGFKINKRG